MKKTCGAMCALVLASIAAPCLGQASQWRITPYAWLAGFDGTMGVPGIDTGLANRIDVTADDLSDFRLRGAMLHGTWRGDRWTAFGDWTYANVKADSPTRFATLYSGVDVKLKGNIVEAYGGYDLLGHGDSHLDVFAGVRYYELELQIGLREGVLPGTLASQKSDWADAVIGMRWDTRFAGEWEAFASADVGGGGSDVSWQVFGGLGYRFKWGSVVAGYRYLHIDYEKSSAKLDAAIAGPFIGASFTF